MTATMSNAYAERYRILPVAVDRGNADGRHRRAVRARRGPTSSTRILKLEIRLVFANPADIRRYIGEFFNLARSMKKAQENSRGDIAFAQQLRATRRARVRGPRLGIRRRRERVGRVDPKGSVAWTSTKPMGRPPASNDGRLSTRRPSPRAAVLVRDNEDGRRTPWMPVVAESCTDLGTRVGRPRHARRRHRRESPRAAAPGWIVTADLTLHLVGAARPGFDDRAGRAGTDEVQREVGGRDPVGVRARRGQTAADDVDERGERAGAHAAVVGAQLGNHRQPRAARRPSSSWSN